MSAILVAIGVFTALILVLCIIVLLARSVLAPQRAVKILINKTQTIQAYTGSKLLAQLTGAGIAIPSACASAGTCGLCKVTVVAGAGPALATEMAKLSSAECERGVRLACQMNVRGDLEIAVSEDILSAKNWQTRVVSTRNLSPLIKEIVLAPPTDEPFEFKPGSYVQVTAPVFRCSLSNLIIDKDHRASWDRLALSKLVASSTESVTRAYSIASTPDNKGNIVLLIRLALPPPGHKREWPPGKVSSWLFSLQSGDAVEVSGPYGDFYVHESDRTIILIGGGVGMAPLRAITHYHLASDSTRKLRLFYGARSCEDLIYAQEMNELVSRDDRFSWTAALSDPTSGDDWTGPIGFIHEVVKEQLIDSGKSLDQCDFYLCGPPLMLQAVVAMLDAAGVSKSNIFADDFGNQT